MSLATVTFLAPRTSCNEDRQLGGRVSGQLRHERCPLALAPRRDTVQNISSGATAADIDRRLWLELTPEQYGLVRELIRLEADAPIVGLLDETERVVDGLAAHFPRIAPSIRAVAQYLIESGDIYEDGAAARSGCEHRQRQDGAGPAS
jgi:hypothetical protein